MAKKQARIKRTLDLEAGTVDFELLRHETTFSVDVREIFPSYDEMNDAQKAVILRAVNNFVGDAASDAEKDETVELPAAWERLKNGEAGVRGGGGSGSGGWTFLHKAFMRLGEEGRIAALKGMDEEEMKENVREMIDGLEDEQKKELRKKPAIKKAIADIKAEEANDDGGEVDLGL